MKSRLHDCFEFSEDRAPVLCAEGSFAEEDSALEDEARRDPASEPALAPARLLWTKRRALGRALVVGLALGVLVALVIPASYESTVQLMPPDSPSGGGMAMLAALAGKAGAGGIGAVGSDLLGLKSSGSLFVGILHSRTILDRLVERFALRKVYGVKLEEDAAKKLAERTGVGEDRKSGIVSLTVSDHDPGRARLLAAAYVEELNRLVAGLSTSSAHRERVFLEGRLAAVKQDLDQAARDVGEFSSKNATLDVKEQAHAMVEAAAALQGALIAVEAERRALEAIYTPNNARVRAAGAREAELRRQLEKLGGKAAGSGDAGAEEAAGSDSVYPSLRRFPLLGVKYEDLYRRARIEEAVFETLTQEYEIAKVEEAKETPSVKILDEASVPERRSFPPRTLITLAGGLAAVLGTSAWQFGRRHWERVNRDDPNRQLAEEIFHAMNARMPWAPPNGSRWQAASHRAWVQLTGEAHRLALKAHDGPPA